MEGITRTAEPNDVTLLVDLMAEFYTESDYPLDRETARAAFEELLGDASLGRVWILMSDREPAGYVVLTLGYSMEYGGRDVFVDDPFVRPQHRGQGLGHVALDAVLAECRERSVRAVHLEVGADNRAARELYHRFGFRDHDRLLLTRGLGEDTT